MGTTAVPNKFRGITLVFTNNAYHWVDPPKTQPPFIIPPEDPLKRRSVQQIASLLAQAPPPGMSQAAMSLASRNQRGESDLRSVLHADLFEDLARSR
jgi:hypothetical protein